MWIGMLLFRVGSIIGYVIKGFNLISMFFRQNFSIGCHQINYRILTPVTMVFPCIDAVSHSLRVGMTAFTGIAGIYMLRPLAFCNAAIMTGKAGG